MRGFCSTTSSLALLLSVAAFGAGELPSAAQFVPDAQYQELYDSENAASLRTHIRVLSSAEMEGRAAGSEGEKAAADYLAGELSAAGVDLLELPPGNSFGICEGSDTLTSRNVIGYIQGSDSKLREHYIVIGAHLDNLGSDTYTLDGQKAERVYYGANDNASGVAMLIELGRMLETNAFSLKRSVLLVGFGASNSSYAGAWYFLNRAFSDTDKIDAMINLDCIGCGSDGFYAFTSSNMDMNTVLRSLEGDLLPIFPQLTSAEVYPSDHRAFYAKEIPSVCFSTGKYPEHDTPRDTESIIDYPSMERILEYLYDFSVRLANTGAAPSFSNVPVTVKRGPSYDDVIPYYECDTRPTFLNSSDPRTFLSKWVYAYLKYPETAVRDGVQGTVMVDFIIGKDGKVTDVRVVRGVSEELDAEALKVVEASPKWKPARVDGNKVRCSMTVPVEFRLEKGGKGGFGINNIRVK